MIGVATWEYTSEGQNALFSWVQTTAKLLPARRGKMGTGIVV